jgi:hypothetical protein
MKREVKKKKTKTQTERKRKEKKKKWKEEEERQGPGSRPLDLRPSISVRPQAERASEGKRRRARVGYEACKRCIRVWNSRRGVENRSARMQSFEVGARAARSRVRSRGAGIA